LQANLDKLLNRPVSFIVGQKPTFATTIGWYVTTQAMIVLEDPEGNVFIRVAQELTFTKVAPRGE
jgi:hypothetical protein